MEKNRNALWRTGLLCTASIFVIVLVFMVDFTDLFNISVQTLRTQPTPAEFMLSYSSVSPDPAYGYETVDPRDPRFYNIILEEEALKFKACEDWKKASSIEHSTISLIGPENGTYNIGEDIRAVVSLHDGYGNRKYAGGDLLKVTFENKVHKASVPCIVTDNNDGTQGIVCKALWGGTSTINVTLAYTRESVTTVYRMRTQVLSTKYIGADFQKAGYKETTLCHPNNTFLLQMTNYTHVCNMTSLNCGMSFYCGKPNTHNLQCQDLQFKGNTLMPSQPTFTFTPCEKLLLERGQRVLKHTLAVNVSNRPDGRGPIAINKPSMPCSKYNFSLLWRSRGPTGFFYDGKWYLLNCFGSIDIGFKFVKSLAILLYKGVDPNHYTKCLKDRRLYIFGDSTTRAWYEAIVRRFQCKQVTEKWKQPKWHKDSECYSRQLNFTAGWYTESQPFSAKTWDEVRETEYSIADRIERIPRNTRAIVVVYLYIHLVFYHHSIFKQRMEIIRKSVETFLRNNKQSIVMIKAPHAFQESATVYFRLSDYVGYVYSRMLYEIFEGLHDQVVLLNNRDTTVAQHNEKVHPPGNIINAMIDQMLSYACGQ